jgi:hypothetical protein
MLRRTVRLVLERRMRAIVSKGGDFLLGYRLETWWDGGGGMTGMCGKPTA